MTELGFEEIDRHELEEQPRTEASPPDTSETTPMEDLDRTQQEDVDVPTTETTDEGPRQRRVTFAEDLPGRDIYGSPIKITEMSTDPSWFFDRPREDVLPFIGRLLLYTRLAIVALQMISNPYDFSTDAFKGVPIQYAGSLDYAVQFLFSGFRRWDAVHFLHISEFGYTWEQNLAFFPLFPMAVRFVARFWATPLIYLRLISVASVDLVSAIALNMVCFLAAGCFLYHITLNITNSVKQATIATLIFAFNPASIFFTAAYSESLFCALTFGGILLLLQYRTSSIFYCVACVLFALAFATRSNGLLNFGYLAWFAFVDLTVQRAANGNWHGVWYRPLSSKILFGLSFVAKIALGFLALTYFVQWHSRVQAQRFCDPESGSLSISMRARDFASDMGFDVVGDDRSRITWCTEPSFLFPPWYKAIQKKYWEVGLFAYWQLKKIPCFLMASPAFVIVVFGLMRTWRQLTQYTAIGELFVARGGMLPFALHAAFMAFGALFVYNVEVFTRILFSSTPFPYLVLAQWIAEITPRVRLSDLQHPRSVPFFWNFVQRGGMEAVFVVYMLTYCFLGTILHVMWLPFT